MDVFPTICSDRDGHDIYLADATKGGGDDRALYCGNCGQAVKLSVAVARTPTPTISATWTFTTADGATLPITEVRS